MSFDTSGTIETSHGPIGYGCGGLSTAEARETVLFLHGNSSSKEVFRKQFAPPLSESYRLLALDLPGHGQSDDALDPARTYGIRGFADAVMEALAGLGIETAVPVGWSMGGHVALELLGRWPGAKAAWITGTPPVDGSDADIAAAFLPSPHMALTFQESLNADETALFVSSTFGPNVAIEPWMLDRARRADGRFRPMMLISAAQKLDVDERRLVRETDKPVAVVMGAEDPFVSPNFLTSLDYGHLWGGQVHLLSGLSHMPFWEAPERINPLLARFLEEVSG